MKLKPPKCFGIGQFDVFSGICEHCRHYEDCELEVHVNELKPESKKKIKRSKTNEPKPSRKRTKKMQ